MLTRPAAAFVFLDETGVATDLIRRYGRGPRGQRVADHAPFGHWEMCTVVAGLRADGLIAPAVLNGPIDTDSFHAYVTQILVPTLRPGDCVVLDNLNVHKDPASAREITGAGATVHFLPPYSPDLNPIELAFAKLKAFLRATRPRSFDEICRRVAEALGLYSVTECAAYLRHCGYQSL
jgi:transposase